MTIGNATRTVVVKLGGTTLAEQRALLEEAAALVSQQQQRIVFVHGGGKRLTTWLEQLAVPSRFQDGLRVTDDAALEVAAAVLGGLVNTELVASLRSLGMNAIGLSGVDGGLLVGRRIPGLGRVATVETVGAEIIERLLEGDYTPVVAPLLIDEHGVVCNVNADDAAAGLAAGLGATLLLLTDADGVLDGSRERIPRLTAAEAEQLIADGVIGGGMIPKVRSALRALDGDDGRAIIADGSAERALERALRDPEFGTQLIGSGSGSGSKQA